MERICVPFNYYFCRTISSCYGNKIKENTLLKLEFGITLYIFKLCS